MRNFTRLFCSLIVLSFVFGTMAMAQTLPIPADQASVVIDETIPGQLETIINGDVDENGNRVNPNRIYVLKAGAVYTQVAALQFGGDTDTTATLRIHGEDPDGARPMVLMNPGAGNGKFQNNINGSIELVHLYWGLTNLNGESAGVFNIRRSNQRVVANGLVTENGWGGTLFNLRGATGDVDIFIQNCYFRDHSQLKNSWNHSILARGDNSEAIDTLWIENTTTTFSSMPFFGKMNPINFFFFNHNTCINGAKYPIWFERYKEAYITNNMFINSNFEGECRSTYETQIGEDFIPGGLINVDTVETNWFNPSITQEDVIFYASDNLSYTSEYLDKYWAGEYNTVADYPISNRVWGSVTEEDLPLKVMGPLPLYNDRTLGLVDAYANMKIERTHENVNPMLVTRSIADQDAGDQFAAFARSNYGVAEEGEEFDRSKMYFGDQDPVTVPGGGTENGYSIVDMTDIPDDFSYTADIVSGIDGNPLGSLAWWPEKFSAYDSQAALELTKGKFAGTTSTEFVAASNGFKVFPNPASTRITLNIDVDELKIYSITGSEVMVIRNYARGTMISVESLKKGMYIIHDGQRSQKLVVK